jgi:uncharacterized membrane protein YfcA
MKKSPQKKAVTDYEQLGRMLENIIETGYVDKARVYKMSFVRGVIGGFGGVIGATLVVAILLWLLSLLHQVPFINKITDNVRDTIHQTESFRP